MDSKRAPQNQPKTVPCTVYQTFQSGWVWPKIALYDWGVGQKNFENRGVLAKFGLYDWVLGVLAPLEVAQLSVRQPDAQVADPG